MTSRVWVGEGLRWYLKRARHPFKDYVVGHYWRLFEKARVWIRYDGSGVINVALGDYLQQQIFWDGYYERPLVEWLKRVLKSDDVFWDVGANIGAISLVAARLCRQVVAFEPDPRSLERLQQNVSANGLRSVEIVGVALGTDSGAATLYQAAGSNSGMTSLVPGRAEVIGNPAVPVVRADDLVGNRPELAPNVMKVDVEGAEHLVFGGASRILRDQRLRAIIFEDRRDENMMPTNRDVVAQLTGAGFRIQPFGFSDRHAADGLHNFLATRENPSGRMTAATR